MLTIREITHNKVLANDSGSYIRQGLSSTQFSL